MKVWRENCSNWYLYIKKSAIALVHMLTKFMPETVQKFTEPWFASILASYDTALQQSNSMESTTEFSDTAALSGKEGKGE